MNTNRLSGWIRSGVAVSLVAGAVAGCGGGGGNSSPPPPPVAVASITVPADNGIAIVGTAKSIPTVVKGTDGSTLTDRTISWASSNTAILAVDATGASGSVTPVATGTATITATVEGKTATMTVYVRNAPTDLASYKAMFPFVSQNGNFIVGSDISQAYSDSRLDHLLKSWDFFQDFFPKQPGDWAEMYYTWDAAIVDTQGGAVCPTAAFASPPGRKLRNCFEVATGTASFLVAPDTGADGTVGMETATALSTLSQGFMDSIKTTDIYPWPWLWEGLSYAFKSGDFDDGQYTMRATVEPERTMFKQALGAGTLLTLTDPALPGLVEATKTRTNPGTWGPQAHIAEPQAAVLLNYLYRSDVSMPQALSNLFTAIDSGTVTTSEQAFDLVLTAAGKTAAQLDIDYKAYGSSL